MSIFNYAINIGSNSKKALKNTTNFIRNRMKPINCEKWRECQTKMWKNKMRRTVKTKY